MVQFIRAVYENGVLKPEEKINLAEHQRVGVLIQEISPLDVGARARAIDAFKRGVTRMAFRSGGPAPRREDLHERR